MNIKRLLSTLLAVIMIIGMVPMAVFAADTAVAEVNGVQYATLQEAIDAANAGDTVKLIADITTDQYTLIGKDLVVDLGEHTITYTKDGTEAGFDLGLGDTDYKGKTLNYLYAALILRADETKEKSINVTIEATTGGITATGANAYAINAGNIGDGRGDYYKTNVFINGGNYTSAFEVVYQNQGLCTINGGTFKAGTNHEELTVNIKDQYLGDFDIFGGSFYGFNPENAKLANKGANSGYLDWSGENYNSVYNEDTNIYTVVNGLQYLIDTTPAGGTVTVDKEYKANVPVVINKNLTLNFGTYSLTSTADAALRIYSDVVDTEINVIINSNGGGITNTNNGFAIYAGEDLEGGNDAEKTNITINGGTYQTNGTDCIRQIMGLCTINGGSYKSSFGRTVLNGVQWYGAEFAINGGSFCGFNPACVSVWTGFNGKDWNNFYHQHDILATNKTVHYADGWYQVVDSAVPQKTVQTKSMCFPSVDVALQAIVDMNDVANLGVITMVANDTLTKADLAVTNNFSFILNGKTLTLPEGYEFYDVTLEDGRAAKKVKATVANGGSNAPAATETVYVSSAADLNDVLSNEESKIIVVNADFALNFDLDLADGSILDLNGHTITLPKKGITVSGKKITVKNGTLGCAVTKGHQYTLYIAEGSTATIEGVTLKGAIYAKNGAELTLKDNTITPWASGNASAVYADGATVTVMSGTFKGSTQGIFKEAFGGEITVYGGRFDRKYAITHKVLLSTMVADGYEVVKAKDGVYKYEVKPIDAE